MNTRVIEATVGYDDSGEPSGLIPASFTLLRAELIPVVVLLAHFAPRPMLFGLCLAAAFLMELFYGLSARPLVLAKPSLRRLGALVDRLFCLAALYAIWLLYPDLIRQHLGALAMLFVLHALRNVLDFNKFGREANYYTLGGRIWAVVLFLAVFGILACEGDGRFAATAIYIGIAAECEALLISIVLPIQRAGVPTLLHAWYIRRFELARSVS